jgi:hypothetical protein
MKGIGIAVSAALAIVFLTVPQVSDGTSGSTWHVTVRNPTGVNVLMTVYYATGQGYQDHVDNAHIPPGGAHTFNMPGAKCPTGLLGSFWVAGGRTWVLRDTSALGHEAPSSRWTAVCANLTFEVCRKAGIEGEVPQDGDFGFCKE